MDAGNKEQTEKALNEFVLQIMSEKGVGSETEGFEGKKNELVEKLKKEVSDATIDALPDDKAIELDELVKAKGDAISEEEIASYFTESQDSIKVAVEKVMADFRERYLRGEL